MANHGQLQNGARRIEELVGKFEAAADRNLPPPPPSWSNGCSTCTAPPWSG